MQVAGRHKIRDNQRSVKSLIVQCLLLSESESFVMFYDFS